MKRSEMRAVQVQEFDEPAVLELMHLPDAVLGIVLLQLTQALLRSSLGLLRPAEEGGCRRSQRESEGQKEIPMWGAWISAISNFYSFGQGWLRVPGPHSKYVGVA